MADPENREHAETHKYPQVVAYLRDTPWAIRETTLAAIMDMVNVRASGHRFTAEEIEARIGAGPARRDYQVAGSVAVIPLYGVITPKADLMSEMSGGTSVQRFKQSLEAALADDKVTSIMLDIDSPGGSTDLIPEMAAQIRQARKQKPIVAMANTAAASAAYWLGSQASEFVVSPSGSVGSIGVFAAHTDVSEAEAKIGLKTTLISAGKFKTEMSPYQPLSDDARAEIQSKVDKFYSMFVQDVARGRATTADAVREGFGQGRMVTARDAVKAGMVDRVDTFDNVLAYMEKGHVPAANGIGAQAAETTVTRSRPCQKEFAEHYVANHADPPDEQTTETAFEAALSGLSFADEAEALRANAEALVDRTRSLAELKSGRLTVTKRERLAACSEALRESLEAIDGFLKATTPVNHTAVAASAEFERLRFIQGATK
jgi:signal peptide peptidase SppA